MGELKFARKYFCERSFLYMDVRAGDILKMKKNHPCGSNEFYVIRAGMDFRLKCLKCSHEFMIPRNKIEKNIRQIIRDGEG